MDDRPPFWQAKADRMVGKTVLVGKSALGPGSPERIQYFGVIESVDDSRGVSVRRADNDEIEWLPPDLRSFEPAPPGIYTLAGSGEEVVDPDFVSTWTVEPPS